MFSFANCCLVPYTISSVLDWFIFNVYFAIHEMISLRHPSSCWRTVTCTSFCTFPVWILNAILWSLA
jgi:hypothetical protein